MERPRAAEREELEVGEVVAAHGRDRLDRLLHLHIDDADDAFGRFGDRKAELLGDVRLNGAMRRGGVELHLAAEKIVLADVAKDDVAVCDGRLSTAAAVAGG